jgi:hypothetical protein
MERWADRSFMLAEPGTDAIGTIESQLDCR